MIALMKSLKVLAFNSFARLFTWDTKELRLIKQNVDKLVLDSEKIIRVHTNDNYKNKLLEADVEKQFDDLIKSSFIERYPHNCILISFRDPNERKLIGDVTYRLRTADGHITQENMFTVSRPFYGNCVYRGTPDKYTAEPTGNFKIHPYFHDYGMFLWRSLMKN
jgi:hypothetical protein